MKGRGRVALACALALGACARAAPEAPERDAARREVSQRSEPASTAEAGAASGPRRPRRPPHPAPRIKAVSAGVAGLSEGKALATPGIALSAGEELVLDFSAGARVRLLGPCVAESAVAETDAMLVRDCTLSIDLAPAAATPDSGFALTTPSATFSLVRSGRLALRAFERGSSVVMVVSGSVSLASAGAAFEPGQRPLLGGERAEIGLDGKLTRSALAERTLESAASVAAALKSPPAARASARQKALPLAALDETLAARVAAFEQELQRERGLVDRHRAAAVSDAGETMALQGELARQAAVLSRSRQGLVTALAQRRASLLGSAQGDADPRVLAARALLAPSP